MSTYYSTLSGWLIPFTRAMEAHHIDAQQAFQACGINPETLRNQESRLATDKFAALLDYCNAKLNGHAFAIEVAKHIHPGMFHALGYAMMSSDTLHEALARIVRYKRVVSNTCTLEVKEDEQQLHFLMHIHSYDDSGRPVVNDGLVEIFLATIMEFCRELISQDVTPFLVNLKRPQPDYDVSYLTEYFRSAVHFDSSVNELVLDKRIANAALLTSNPLISTTHEKILDDLLARINKDDLIYRIKNKIYDDLSMGAPSQLEIAEHLGMSLRNLQRRLSERDISYKEILETTKRKLALDYIRQPHLSFSEIGYLVGFSSVGNFNRAFKRWTGQSPGAYRRQQIACTN